MQRADAIAIGLGLGVLGLIILTRVKPPKNLIVGPGYPMTASLIAGASYHGRLVLYDAGLAFGPPRPGHIPEPFEMTNENASASVIVDELTKVGFGDSKVYMTEAEAREGGVPDTLLSPAERNGRPSRAARWFSARWLGPSGTTRVPPVLDYLWSPEAV